MGNNLSSIAPEIKKEYGYVSTEEQNEQWIHMSPGQNIAGYAIGILYLDKVWYPMMPGNVVNACTYNFPVRLKAVPDLDTPKLHSGDPANYEAILNAAKELKREGVRAISSACGFFGHFHKQLAEDIDIPVALSSLVQVPWIKTLLQKDQKIGVLTANASGITEKLLKSCYIEEPEDLIVADLRNAPHFSAIMEDRGSFDNARVREEVTGAAKRLTAENRNIGAILLECSDMPPYAAAIQRAVGLPVFDFITMIRWLYFASVQKPYEGII